MVSIVSTFCQMMLKMSCGQWMLNMVINMVLNAVVNMVVNAMSHS